MIKKGKMTKEKIKQKLKETFKDFKFFPSDHHYEYKGKRVGISVTRLIEEYCNEFDSQAVAEKVAEKNLKNYEYAKTQLQLYNPLEIGGNDCLERYDELKKMLELPITVTDVLNEWEYKNQIACEKGHFGHLYAQSLWNGEIYQEHIKDGLEAVKIPLEKIKQQADNFYNDYKDKLEHLGDELVIGSAEYDIASAIDHLFYNKLTGGLVLVDYKTNSILKGYNDDIKNRKYTKKMKIPLNKIEDDSLHHYYIQLSIYKFLIEKYTGLKIDEMFIVYFSENIDNYEIIEIPYLKNEVKKILELRRANKMAKMLLIMGEPASGKTVSLRNIPKNELYYIDCDKKGLNYKGWKNDFNEEKKNYLRSNDGEFIAKCMQGISEKREDIKYIAIDTINSIMIADEMKRSKDKNFDKWVDLASCIFNLINIVPDLRDDLTVIFIGHTQTDDEGFTRLLTNGKKLNKIGLEKYFDTVLIAKNNDGKYVFETTSPNSTARVPMGCYEGEQYIDNDLYEIIKELKEY